MRSFNNLIAASNIQLCKGKLIQIQTLIRLLGLLFQGLPKLKWLLTIYKLTKSLVMQTTRSNNVTKLTQRTKKHKIWLRDSKLIFFRCKRSHQFMSVSSTLAQSYYRNTQINRQRSPYNFNSMNLFNSKHIFNRFYRVYSNPSI